MPIVPTTDPFVVIEEQGDDWVRYHNTVNGRRWEVHGVCDRRGDCLIGAVIHNEVVRDKAHLEELTARYGERPDSYMDVPVTPEFSGCCPFSYVEL
jgi:hypothetical protein